jgi:hypothetical protein
MANESASPPPELVLILDRVEGPTAVLLDAEGRQIAVPVERLPRNPRPSQGDVLRVPVDDAQRPDWFAARVDQEETERRRAAARAVSEGQDPGGTAVP